MHYDFLLASQSPISGSELREIPGNYQMPARMWRYGIHLFLDLLLENLPDSLDFLIEFTQLAYSMMTLCLESFEVFCDIWMECLGDLARCRMVIEDRDQDIWAEVARYWYNQSANFSPGEGRIQHHLGVLAYPDTLQKLCHYTRALVSIRPFLHTQKSIGFVFSPYHEHRMDLGGHTMTTAFIATHYTLYYRRPVDEFSALATCFLDLLRKEAVQDQTALYIMSCNFASVLQYGDIEAIVALEMAQKDNKTATEPCLSSPISMSALDLATQIKDARGLTPANFHVPPMALQGAILSFHTLSILIDSFNESSVCASVHISLSFIWCLALRPNAIQRLEKLIPWTDIARFLNTLINSDIVFEKIEDRAFPRYEGVARYLPEDFLIRGQTWSQLYYPHDFFQDTASKEEISVIEDPSIGIPRRHRCLWLGVRIATATVSINLLRSLYRIIVFTHRNDANRLDM
ncbi:uncharacterized protein N7496_000847 [Penicillium cataractarum]|uniref:DNA/RNA-binding domain-containing protein n=1 Tax=Penicillium cataractarum TaxID=2100454 RepID=A0A9X0B6B3_9EURO|nr:uncharacterized protein N7496_000847 [Penicillium cataractarum]KAJ5389779.1 hypothetical protein N7496_000847 [Penicillium cataractarum]